MKPLIAVALHDRPELVGPCLESLRSRAGAEFELAICADGCTYDPTPFLKDAEYVDVNPSPTGHAGAVNTSMKHRQPGQHYMIVDSDIEFLTDNWLALLLETLEMDRSLGVVSPCLGDPGPPWWHQAAPDSGLQFRLNMPLGARLIRGEVVDRLGYFRPYGTYGCEDLDYDERVHRIGFTEAYDTRVQVKHPGIPADAQWKRQRIEECLPVFKNWETLYWQGKFLHRDNPEEDYIPEGNPRWLSAVTDDYGTHLPMLRWAVEHTDGPILELGTGFHSTPYLHEVSETGRRVVSWEENKRWLKLARDRVESSTHQIVTEIPTDGEWAVVLVDDGTADQGKNRTKWLDALRPRTEVFVCHDTEPEGEAIYHWQPLFDTFTYRYDFRPDKGPHTTLVSDTNPLLIEEALVAQS